MPSVIQPSFALGELSDDLSGRVDLEWYGKGLALCDNFYVLASGGVTFRPGTEFVCEVPDSARPHKLLAFEFSAEETYALLLGDKSCRVIQNGGLVLAPAEEGSDGVPYSLELPYVAEELAELRAAQSADVLYLVHPNHPPAKLMRYGHADWRYEVLTFASKLAPPTGLGAYTTAGGSVTYRYKVTAYDKDAGEESEASAEVAVASKDLGLDNTVVNLSWQPVPGAKEYKVYKFEAGMWGLVGYAGSATDAPVSVVGLDVRLPSGETRHFDRLATRYTFRVANVDDKGNLKLTIMPNTDKFFPPFGSFDCMVYYDAGNSACLIGGMLWDPPTPTFPCVWCRVEGVPAGIVGEYTSYAFVPEWGNDRDHPSGRSSAFGEAVPVWTAASAVRFTDANYAADTTLSPPAYENPFQGPGNYPSVVAFIQQRLCFAGTRNDPQKIWMSRSGNFENFGRSNPTRDDDAVYLTISSSQVNWIRGLVTLRSLLAMTGGGEWTIDAGSQGGAITPASVNVTQQSAYGTANLEPRLVGQSILIAQRGFTAVRDLAYSFDIDGYAGNDLTIRAPHLFRGHRLTAWDYQNAPDGVLWCARDDGALLALTYVKEHQVYAWSRHHTEGVVEDVCCVNSDERDELYFIVRRNIGGAERRYVERLARPYRSEEGPVAGAWHVDAGLRYRAPDGEAVTRLAGLSHLAGKKVAVLADGGPLDNLEVDAQGELVLPRPASDVVVGLPYAGTLKTMRVNTGDEAGTSQGRRQTVTRVTLRLRDSVGGETGWERRGADGAVLETRWSEIKTRTLHMANQPSPPFTGDREHGLPAGWDTGGQFLIRQKDPLPFTLLCAIPEVTLGGR